MVPFRRFRYDSASPRPARVLTRQQMASYSTNEFRSGLRIIIDGQPCIIVENEFVKPGKGQAFNRVRIRNLKTGKTVDKTFKSGESVEAADVMDTEMQYLYSDGEFWHFMVPIRSNSLRGHIGDRRCQGLDYRRRRLWYHAVE